MTVSDSVKSYLDSISTPPSLIKRGILYTADDMAKLRVVYNETLNKAMFLKLFQRDNGSLFIFHAVCSCDFTEETRASKTRFIEYLKDGCFTCSCCAEKQRIINKNIDYELCKKRKEQIHENTDRFIRFYCSCGHEWKDGVKYYEKWRTITQYYVNWDAISNHLKGLKYKDFLKTLYWNAVACKVKHKANYRCQMCNSNSNLNVHHRCYDHHGMEHAYIQDLICICRECHKHFHVVEGE